MALAARCHSATDLIEVVGTLTLEEVSWPRAEDGFFAVLPPRSAGGNGAPVGAPDAR